MILTVVGGSAYSTPVLIDALSAASFRFDLTIRLVGRNRSRLSAVARAGRLLTRMCIEEYEWQQLPAALYGSDFVLIQIRPGGLSGRHFDQSFPLAEGVPGDEGLGPGGLSAAWRGWPILRLLLRTVRACAPNAHPILLTSPGSLLVRLAANELPNWPLMGVCELPWTTLCQICGSAERAIEASFDYAGVNHIGWLYNVRLQGEDRIRVLGGAKGHNVFPSPDLVRRLAAYPLKYLKLHYMHDQVVRDQLLNPDLRTRQLESIAGQSFAAFASGNLSEIRAALRLRPADWYTDAVVPLIRGLFGETVPISLFLTMAVSGGVIQERRYQAEGGRLTEVKQRLAPPKEVQLTLERFIEYEACAAAAILWDSERHLADALAMHPWVHSRTHAEKLARSIIRQGDRVERPKEVMSYA